MDDSRTERLVDSLMRSRILGPEDTPRFELLRAEFDDPDGLAREMVRREWLTSYQAEQLLDGRVEGVVLGPYLLLDLLGEGGMGRVYKARHRLMNRVVALKVIRAELLAAGEARLRFLREIEAAARVWHPNLVTALDAAPIGDSYVLVMEYVEGTTLSKLLQDRGVPPIRHTCDWVRQAALGLHHAHEQGLIHRDIKPSNLLLTDHERLVKVMDLGLARLDLLEERPPEDEPLTASGVVIGTPDYMAPEQAISPRSADARSDIYSLGCTLYHLLTGRPPFPGGSFTQKLLWHQQLEPADPSRLRPSLPPGLLRVLARMTAKAPENRYSTAAEAAADLEFFCSTAGIKTLHAPDAPTPASDLAITPAPTQMSPSPMMRRDPIEATAYDLVDGNDEDPDATPVPGPPLLHPAAPDDDSWWKDDLAGKPPAGHDATPAPRPPSARTRTGEGPVAPRGRLGAWIGLVALVIVLTALVLWAVGVLGR
jgi:serine/threonine protein kinase